MKNRIVSIALSALAAAVLLCGCAVNAEPAVGEPEVGESVKLLPGVELDYDNMFFDGFNGAIDYDSWFIGKQSWGAGGNGGVIPENVNYTDDGVLVITGNGNYYTAGEVKGVGVRTDGSLTGGAIISKFTVGPGRYETKMKVLPRLGACTAFWIYAYDYATGGNHEIDIEIPGGKTSGNIGFDKVLNTNYVTEQRYQSQDVSDPLTEQGAPTLINDGEWHTFGFDWYTLEQGENESDRDTDTSLGRVVYYIDGKVTAVSDAFVPYYKARLWLGVWFPNTSGFVGDAYFETDYMYVDYVSYTPFKGQPAVEFNPTLGATQVATASEYPTVPVSTVKANKVANGSFEFAERGATDHGWVKDAVIIDKGNEYCFFETGIGRNGTCGARVTDKGLLWQDIDSVYGGFELKYSLYAKGAGKLTVWYFGAGGSTEVGKQEIDLTSADWKEFVFEYTAPEGTRSVELQFTASSSGDLFVDDIRLEVN